MRPERDTPLVDLLDRLLVRGAVLSADLIITVGGVPLIGLSLRALIASMETMLDYGLMEDWDKSTREWYSSRSIQKPIPEGEVLFQSFGYLWSGSEIHGWRPGVLYLTENRIVIWRRNPPDMLMDLPVSSILCLEKEIDISPRMLSDDASEGPQIINIKHRDGTVRIRLREYDEFYRVLGRLSFPRIAAPT